MLFLPRLLGILSLLAGMARYRFTVMRIFAEEQQFLPAIVQLFAYFLPWLLLSLLQLLAFRLVCLAL